MTPRKNHQYLIVDDDRVFADVLARSLMRRGLQARVAHSPDEALSACRRLSPERVILDLKLGETSGLALIGRIREAAPGVQILVLTGYSSIPTTVQAIKLGALNYLCKPASVEDIIGGFDAVTGRISTPISDTPHSVERLQWEHIQKVLAENDGNISATARALGMHRRTLQRKLQKRPVRN